jgi:tetratricopeptide (TPR) repeat protein
MAVVASLALSGCAGISSRKCTLPVEKTDETYLLGMNYLEEQKPALAAGAFKDILSCNKRHSASYSGLAIAYSQMAAAEIHPDGQTMMAAVHSLQLARKYSKTKEDEFRLHLATMRVSTTYKSQDWLGHVEREYRKAMKTKVDPALLPYYQSSDPAGYYMGRAYFDAGRIESAMDEYKALAMADPFGKWGKKAERAYKRSGLIIQHIERAVSSPEVVVLAFHRALTREDIAAILIEELRVDELLEMHELHMAGAKGMAPVPADIFRSRFRNSILKVVALGIKGLEPSYSEQSSKYIFRPRKVVTRKDFAVILDGLLNRLSLMKQARKEGQTSRKPFSDVPPGVPWYTAVMDVTAANLMMPKPGGLFKPYDGLDGPDAFRAIMDVKDMVSMR